MALQAAAALDQLSGLMRVRDDVALSKRLHVRAAEMRYMPELDETSLHKDEQQSSPSDGSSSTLEKLGVQLRSADEVVFPLAVQSLITVADLHASRGRLPEALRVMERVLEMEEQRIGNLDARLVPLLTRYATYVEASGRVHEAQAIRLRASELHELQILPPVLRVPVSASSPSRPS